ncbi:GPAA1 [Symbiodinium sp. CCMP2592]|nr:GPAA1 [Symbiodinium sp. CCMP2592]
MPTDSTELAESATMKGIKLQKIHDYGILLPHDLKDGTPMSLCSDLAVLLKKKEKEEKKEEDGIPAEELDDDEYNELFDAKAFVYDSSKNDWDHGDALTSGGEADVDVGADCANDEVEDTSCGEKSPLSSPPSPSSQVTAPTRKSSGRGRRRRPRSRAAGAGRTATLHTVWDLSGSSEDTCDCDTKEQRQKLDRYREICFCL